MGWPLPNKELVVINHSRLSDPISKELTDVNRRSAEAKIGGITPGTLIFKGRCESPEKILFPTCLFGYWTIIFFRPLNENNKC